MLQLLAGTAVIASPPQISLPIAAAMGVVKVLQAVRDGRSRHKGIRRVAKDIGSAAAAVQDAVAVEPAELVWSNVTCTLTDPKHPQGKRILQGVSGVARPGRLTALMGPSGSGKTTLLNTLAGQLPVSKSIALEGELTVNGEDASSGLHKQAYVQQEDIFYSQLTVREILTLAAELRLPADMTPAARTAYVDRLISVLGLAQCQDARAGDAKTRGISGGERKRLSIGSELIGSPSLIFLDEPTTGLDSFQAEKVMRTMKELARSGHTVVSSIHQPRSSIFALFDDLVLLSEGRCLFFGPASEIVSYFEQLGHRCGTNTNPAEFVADLISIDCSSPQLEASTRARVAGFAAAWNQRTTAAGKTAASADGLPSQQADDSPSSSSSSLVESVKQQLATATATRSRGIVSGGAAAAVADGSVLDAAEPRVGPLRQLKLLLSRSWKQATRDKGTNMSRAISSFSSAMIFGAIFFRLKRGQSGVQDRLGLLQVAAINTAMSSLVKTLNVFPRERTIVNRERAAGSYGPLAYLTAKLSAEAPIGALFPLLFGCCVYPLTGLNPSAGRFAKFLATITLESFTSAALGLAVGAIAPSTEAALAIGPAVMVVFIVFGGSYVNADNVPLPLRWLPKASLIKQGFEGLCANELRGLTFSAAPEGSGRAGGMQYRTGEQVLSWLSFERSSVRKAMLSQARILAFWYYATFCLLKASKPRFTPMAPPKPVQLVPTAADDTAQAAT
ncbi:MAG: hypothetical protein WDW38_011386 [Sanguina aurantia]